jgi:hypothetical protein
MGRKRDTSRQRDDVNQRRGSTRREKGGDDVSSVDVNLPRKKKKIHVIDAIGPNG